MYNLIEYCDNCSKTSGSLWQCFRDEMSDILVFPKSFKSKIKITEKNPAADDIKDVEIAVLLKYVSNFWRILKCCQLIVKLISF